MNQINQIWPKWQVVDVLGQGGFGTVYKCMRENAFDVSYSAIKVVKIPQDPSELKEMTTSGMTKEHIKNYYKESVASLLNEIKLMESLKSAPNIVGIEDYELIENEDGIGWTVLIRMELLTNLSDFMDEYPFGVHEVLQMGIDICKALEICHKEKIIHRDIKPENIFVSKFGDFKLGDFGVSKEVENRNATLSQKGTKSYMAPEMVRLERNYNHTVDLYALGLTIYELLNHHRMPFLPPFPEPFFAKQREDAMLKRLTGEPFPPIEGIGEINDILQKACAFQPKERYQSATELKDALIYAQNHLNDVEDIDIQSTDYAQDQSESFGKTIGVFSENFDKTIGVFSDVDTMLFSDVEEEVEKTEIIEKVEKENKIERKEPQSYEIQCPKCKKKANLVFTNGYYCGEHVTITSNDKETQNVKKLYEKYLEEKNKLAALKKVLSVDDCAMLHYQLGKHYIDSSSKKYARNEFKRAYELDSWHIGICKDRALVHLEEKEYDLALDVIVHAESLIDRKTSPTLQAIIHATKAIALQRLKRPEEALKTMIEAMKLASKKQKAWHEDKHVLSESVIFEFLYEKNTIYSSEEDYCMNLLFYILQQYGIGKAIYAKIFENARRKNKVTMYGANLPNVTRLRKEKCYSKKGNLSKTYYISENGIYPFSTMFSYGLTYIAYTELGNQCTIHLENNNLVIKGFSEVLKIPVPKNHGQWIYESLIEIQKFNCGK